MSRPSIHPAIDEVERRLKHSELVARLVSVLLSAGAHIHGDVVAHGVLLGDALRVHRIEASVAPPLVAVLPRILAVDFASSQEDLSRAGRRETTHSLTLRNGRSASVELVLHAHVAAPFRAPVEFDFQTLSMSASRLYCRVPSNLVSMIPRVCGRRFALAGAAGDAGDHARWMRGALRLLESGWMMDASTGWVLARWGNLTTRSAAAHVRPAPGIPLADAVCPICHDRFDNSDIVASLECSHNIHAVCMGKGGMCAWLAAGHTTCPCCRADVRPKQLS